MLLGYVKQISVLYYDSMWNGIYFLQISAFNVSTIEKRGPELKAAKKMPENPETMNPLMLLNQMLPQVVFEEAGTTGTAPNIQFHFRCNVDGQTFEGTGEFI